MQFVNNFFGLFSHDIGIDLGTANTLVWVRGKGIVIREPSVVARHRKTKEVIAIGTEAKLMVGKTPATIETVRPLREGVIADFDAARVMVEHYVKEVKSRRNDMTAALARPRVAIGIPSSSTEVQRRAVWEASLSAGAREAFLVEEPMAAAIGAGVSVFAPTGVMVVDMGGGTTEIAIISLGGIVVSRSLPIAGDNFDEAIVHYIRLRHGLLIGERTAEELKISIGSAYELTPKQEKAKKKKKEDEEEAEETEEEESEEKKTGEKVAVIRGRDLETGLPKSIRIHTHEVREALMPVLMEIISAIMDIVHDAPPELTSDILEHGILVTGGGSLLPGVDRLIVEHTKIPVLLAEDPLTTVVRGCGKVLEDMPMLDRVKVTGGLK